MRRPAVSAYILVIVPEHISQTQTKRSIHSTDGPSLYTAHRSNGFIVIIIIIQQALCIFSSPSNRKSGKMYLINHCILAGTFVLFEPLFFNTNGSSFLSSPKMTRESSSIRLESSELANDGDDDIRRPNES